jgi:hypothetical protein
VQLGPFTVAAGEGLEAALSAEVAVAGLISFEVGV